MDDRESLAYWLRLEGIDLRTIDLIVGLDEDGENPILHFPRFAAKIERAYEGRYCVLHDC